MPSFDSIIVGEDWISEHFFTTDSTKESFQSEVIKLRKSWDETAKDGHDTTLSRWNGVRGKLQGLLAGLSEDPMDAAEAYTLLRRALGFPESTSAVTFQRNGTETTLEHVWATEESDVVFIEADPADSVEDVLSAVEPRGVVQIDGKMPDPALTVAKAVSEIYLSEEEPKFVVIMAGRWIVLTERERWAEGRYLAADAQLVAERGDAKKYAETDRFLAIFGRESLMPSPDGAVWWDGVLEASVKHTVGVSQDLREGIRRSIEIIANDVLDRRRALGLDMEDVDGQVLARQSLRFLYRILFLLYAEASPEMGVLPVGSGEYNEGYGLDRLRELTLVNIQSPESRRGSHIYESLNQLFQLVDTGHTPINKTGDHSTVANEGLTFRPLKADLFQASATSLIVESKLSNSELQRVLQHLLLSKETRGKDRGFISYAELGINQLGAVYEGLMSYTGIIAETDLHEVAKNGSPAKGSWVVPVDRSESIESKHFVLETDEQTGEQRPVLHPRGSFVFRLAGRERQQSASYYTPEVLTKFVVSEALEELLDQDGKKTTADEILQLTVCEPALGSGAFAIEAVRQLAAKYLERKQEELKEKIPADSYPEELQKVKAQIALHQVHGVDLNSTAVELAEVSLWLDTMVKELQAPWFGLRLRRGNSLIGSRRATYSRQTVADKTYLKSAPQAAPLTGLVESMQADTDDAKVAGRIYHFLLPAEGWGAAADVKEVKDIASEAQKDLKAWRSKLKTTMSKKQLERLVSLSGRTEALWKLSLRRLQIAESEARRDIDYYGKISPVESAENRPVTREQIEAALNDPQGAYQRLRRVMDAWNALWFWPLTEHATGGVRPPSVDEWLGGLEAILGFAIPAAKTGNKYGYIAGQTNILSGASWEDLDGIESTELILAQTKSIERALAEHPWLEACERIAAEQGFFHWELEFASVFGRGGFDLQVGNPPWVRPMFDETAMLAEGDPWWQLSSKPSPALYREKRIAALKDERINDLFISASISVAGVKEFLGGVLYPEVFGLQPDLYRSFMLQTWRLQAPRGVVGLIHPESHFNEKKAAELRRSTYRRLRRHWQFINELSLFEIHHLVAYGVHIYGSHTDDVSFLMASSLYAPETASRSMEHDGSGAVPGIKDENGKWDLRPHRDRIMQVDNAVLEEWKSILEPPLVSHSTTRMLYPINKTSSDVLKKLAATSRARDFKLPFAAGWREHDDVKKGHLVAGSAVATHPDSVIIQGPHISVATPLSKQPNRTMRNNLDWSQIDLEAINGEFLPRTSYQPSDNTATYDNSYSSFLTDGHDESSRGFFRIAWRLMAATTGVRTFYPAIIPPGVAHTHGMMSTTMPDEELCLNAGLWSSLIIDFLVKVTGTANINATVIEAIPCISEHILQDQVIERVLRLNCLNDTYAPLVGSVSSYKWDTDFPIRRSADRRQAMVEIDALAALVFGVTADELCAIYRTQFPVLRGYERNDLYDVRGRKVPGEISKLYRQAGESLSVGQRSWTHPQSGVEYVFEFPFRTFDREEDMRKAYSHFEKVLAEKRAEELAQ